MFIDSFCGIKGTALATVCTLEPPFLCPLERAASHLPFIPEERNWAECLMRPQRRNHVNGIKAA